MKITPYDGRYDQFIATLVELIKHKMAEHSYKGEWTGIDMPDLMNVLEDEVTELNEAINVGNMVEALREVGDVGVCLVMLAEALMRGRTLTVAVAADIRAKAEREKG